MGRGAGVHSETVCYQFQRFGRCQKGASCKFKHVRQASIAVERVDGDFLLRHCEVEKAHAGAIHAIVSSPEGIYTVSQDKSLKRWKPQQGPGGLFMLKADLEVPLKESCFSMIRQDGWIFCGLWDGSIRAFSEDHTDITLTGHTGRVSAMLIHENVLISGSADQEVRLWQFDAPSKNFHCTHTIKDTPGAVHKLMVMGPNLIIGGSNGVAICGLQSLTVSKILPPVKFVADFLEFQGHLIVAYSDGTLRVFDAEGTLKAELKPTPAGSIIAIAGLESGPRVVCTHSKGKVSTVVLPSFEHKLHYQAFEGGRVESIMCAPDGIFLLGNSSGALQLWQRMPPAGAT